MRLCNSFAHNLYIGPYDTLKWDKIAVYSAISSRCVSYSGTIIGGAGFADSDCS